LAAGSYSILAEKVEKDANLKLEKLLEESKRTERDEGASDDSAVRPRGEDRSGGKKVRQHPLIYRNESQNPIVTEKFKDRKTQWG